VRRGDHPGGDIDPTHATRIPYAIHQADKRVSCATSDLEHPIARRDRQKAQTQLSRLVFARVGYEVIDRANPVIEAARLILYFVTSHACHS
jgi:hypothetical protein